MTNALYIGSSGTGTFTQSGELISSTDYPPENANSSGTYNHSSGNVTFSGILYVGGSGTGVVNQSGGLCTVLTDRSQAPAVRVITYSRANVVADRDFDRHRLQAAVFSRPPPASLTRCP